MCMTPSIHIHDYAYIKASFTLSGYAFLFENRYQWIGRLHMYTKTWKRIDNFPRSWLLLWQFYQRMYLVQCTKPGLRIWVFTRLHHSCVFIGLHLRPRLHVCVFRQKRRQMSLVRPLVYTNTMNTHLENEDFWKRRLKWRPMKTKAYWSRVNTRIRRPGLVHCTRYMRW